MNLPMIKAATRPTTVDPPMTIAAFSAPMDAANTLALMAKVPMNKPYLWPRLASDTVSVRAARSISCRCFASASAIERIRSAAPGRIILYSSSNFGGGSGPEKDCVTIWLTLGGPLSSRFFIFVLIGKPVDSGVKVFSYLVPVAPESVSIGALRDKIVIIGTREYVENASHTVKDVGKMFFHGNNLTLVERNVNSNQNS